MGEVDTKPIESVQAAIALFGELKQRSDEDIDEEGLEVLHKELANCKVQLEAKESAYMQSLLKLQHYDERTDILSSQLMKSELERDISVGDLREARACIKELEYKLKEITECLTEKENAHEQLVKEIKVVQVERLSTEAIIALECESKNQAVKQAEEIKVWANMEKEKVESLLKRVEELDETIHALKAAALEDEAEKSRNFLEKDAQVELATSVVLRMQEDLDRMEKRLDFIRELENQVFAKSMIIESLQSDLKESDFTIGSLKEDVAQATKYAEELRGELEAKDREASDRAFYNEMLEVELNQLKEAAGKSNNKDNHMSQETFMVGNDYHSTEIELSEFEDGSTSTQVEIAMLKAELNQTRLRLAAAEVKDEGIRSGLYFAVQQLPAEAEEVKNDQKLKQAVETDGRNPLQEKLTFDEEAFGQYAVEEALREEKCEEVAQVTISSEEYETLKLKAKKADEIPTPPMLNANKHEKEMLKRDLEAAQAKVGEFRTRVELALARAEAAEKARAVLEDKLSRRRDRKQGRKAALAALLEVSVLQESPNPQCEEGTSTISSSHTPLWKVLNMRYY